MSSKNEKSEVEKDFIILTKDTILLVYVILTAEEGKFLKLVIERI